MIETRLFASLYFQETAKQHMKIASFKRHDLIFKKPGGTSRGVLHSKETFILTVQEGGKTGIGECALFRSLSIDDVENYEEKLQWLCENITLDSEILQKELLHYPSIWIGYEQAMLNLKHDSNIYFPSRFTNGETAIKINGLIWMGNADFIRTQIQEKLALGFNCIKLKIGVDWNAERNIIEELREDYPSDILEIRVDANGAFTPEKAETVLQQLAELKIHSIEQPIKAGNTGDMAELCRKTPTPIALDEELIGLLEPAAKEELLRKIMPQFIILKPSLIGGFSGCDEWIETAEKLQIGWWITSALESNIGLNAIAQYTATKNSPLPQGLGTGALFTNNFESALQLEGDQLRFAGEGSDC